MRRLICIGGGCLLLSWFIGEPSKTWVGGIGSLAVIAVFVVLLADLIAGRKEWEAASGRGATVNSKPRV
ncbi:MAG: hypothetical protein WCT12_17000 [Verrucomicrobiota bacterium]|jgi:hypothetical protein